MAETRRKFIKVIGSSAIIVAAGGGGWALTRDPKSARLPWKTAGQGYDDPIRNALSYAILAPNPHNRQPWLVDLKSDTEAVLYCQLDRRLPETDPFDRQITIGLGCFLENLRIAAVEGGFFPEITPFPDGSDAGALDARPIAHIHLKVGARVVKDPLFAAIPNRRTDRGAFDTARPVAQNVISDILSAGNDRARIHIVDRGEKFEKLRKLSWDAWAVEMHTPAKHHESMDLLRIGKKEINANPDGISLAGPLMEGLNKLGVVTQSQLKDPSSSAFSKTLEFGRPGIETAMAYVVISSPSNDRVAQIAAGVAYVRTNLIASANGVSMQPLSQALQEYVEMEDYYQRIHEMLADQGETIQMLARIGYGDGAPPAPRWPLDTRIKT